MGTPESLYHVHFGEGGMLGAKGCIGTEIESASSLAFLSRDMGGEGAVMTEFRFADKKAGTEFWGLTGIGRGEDDGREKNTWRKRRKVSKSKRIRGTNP